MAAVVNGRFYFVLRMCVPDASVVVSVFMLTTCGATVAFASCRLTLWHTPFGTVYYLHPITVQLWRPGCSGRLTEPVVGGARRCASGHDAPHVLGVGWRVLNGTTPRLSECALYRAYGLLAICMCVCRCEFCLVRVARWGCAVGWLHTSFGRQSDFQLLCVRRTSSLIWFCVLVL